MTLSELKDILLRRFTKRDDSEHEQAIVRIVLVVGIFIYFFIVEALFHSDSFKLSDRIYAFVLYEAVSIAYVVWVGVDPAPNRLRRSMGLVTDFAAISLTMYFGGEAGMPLYPLYLWVALGNGFRFGLRYLMASCVLAVSGFAVVLAMASPWRDHPLLGLGLLMGLVAIPAYSATLIRKLTEAKIQAEAASRAKSRFLAMVSHELRTPLNAIIGLSDLMLASRLDDDQLDMSRTIQLSGRALLSLIDSVLDFSRIEAGKTAISLSDFDLHNGLSELVSVVRHQAAEKGLALYVSTSGDVPPFVRVDWPHVRQVLTNLLANAVKFTERGSVTLRVSCDYLGFDERLVFEVEDTGIGIPEDKMALIFDAFAQVEDSVNRRFGGSGLGLAISRQLTDLMGGGLSVASRLGVGSTFRLELPLAVVPHEPEFPLPLHVIAFCRRDRLPRAGMELAERTSFPPNEDEAIALVMAATIREPAVLILDEDSGGKTGGLMGVAHAQGVSIVMLGNPTNPLPQALVTLAPDSASSTFAAALRAAAVFGGRRSCADQVPDQRASRSLRVLVAEDNRINVKVICKMLQMAGHRADVVGTGDALLDALEKGGYDIVVADVNMPGMPLIEVVKLHRMAELNGPYLPIVALSADATLETRRDCELAGVDLYLTKPVVATTLLSAIDQLTRKEQTSLPFAGGNVSDLTKHPGFTGPAALPVDWEAIDALVALGDRELVRELTEEFLEDAIGLIDSMEQAAAQGDIRHFRAECHALRSCAANVGARSITRLCQARTIASDGFASEGRSFCARAREELVLYRDEMARYLARDVPQTKLLH